MKVLWRGFVLPWCSPHQACWECSRVSLTSVLAPRAHCCPLSTPTHQVLVTPFRIFLGMGISYTDNVAFQKLELPLCLCRPFHLKGSLQHFTGSSQVSPTWAPLRSFAPFFHGQLSALHQLTLSWCGAGVLTAD